MIRDYQEQYQKDQEAEWKLYQEQTRTGLIHSMDFDASDAYLLEKIAMAEAESEDTEGKALVMLVVLNRVWDTRFPDTIEEVIMQDGAFTPVSNGRYDKVEPDADCMKAMELITVEHWDESQGALYFEKASDESTGIAGTCRSYSHTERTPSTQRKSEDNGNQNGSQADGWVPAALHKCVPGSDRKQKRGNED